MWLIQHTKRLIQHKTDSVNIDEPFNSPLSGALVPIHSKPYYVCHRLTETHRNKISGAL